MTVKPNRVTIKGIKDGLVFLLDDQCEFDELLGELRFKLEHSHQNILTGPIVHVDIKMGNREISEEQKESLLEVLRTRGNLLIRSVESPNLQSEDDKGQHIHTMTGMVRSGQVLHYNGNLLFLGDVNPGGAITCTGDLFILGSLRGMAHAGMEGNREAIIAASYFAPTQVRISDVISRPPDEWESREAGMEFAYLQEDTMQIDKITNIGRLRREFNVFKGV
ncbi:MULTISPECIES: septum site-determining protein MinC [Paenibacillus]|uniref:septum site-determining protein MinC n=1 Tax=Paenibacillus TaxID=44249 RepID=UPI00036D7E91|nr:septum site-determining protein MinC [Paenibacillus massiliensis]